MRSSTFPQVLLAAALTTTSSAIDFGSVSQTAGTVAPNQATDGSTMSSDPNGFGKGGMPTQFMSPSGGGAGIGGQGWPQQAGSAGPPNFGGGKGQMGWPSHQWGGQGETLGVDCSGSGDQGGWSGGQGWTSPGGDQEGGALGVDCSGSNEGVWSHQGWKPPSGGQGWWGGGQGWASPGGGQGPPGGDQGGGTLGVDCSGSTEGGWAPPGGGQGWGTFGSGTKEGGWTPPSGGEGPGTPFGSGPKEGEWTPPKTSFSFPGSNGGGGIPGPAEGSSLTETSMVSSNTDDQGDSTTDVSGVSSGNGTENQRQPSLLECPVALEIRSHRLP
ncbi:hypothetical protein GQ600_1248 [Phytophthora cactorum]|nr:hypothetical protein GQ600_1248 [Phytophthora cactorum]